MKNRNIRIAMAGLLAGATVLAGSTASAQGNRQHLSESGATCIYFMGVTYDPASQYYTAHWENKCGYNIRIRFYRTDPTTRQSFNDTRVVLGGGAASALLLRASSLDAWEEVFDF